MRDSIYILAGLVEQQTSLQPQADTAGASDVVVGLFCLLGCQYSPRLADIGGARFWRIDPNADYGPLDRLSRHPGTIERIARHWEDMLRIAGSLKLGIIGAAELVRSLLGYLSRKTVPESSSSHCGGRAGEILGGSVGCRRFVLDVR